MNRFSYARPTTVAEALSEVQGEAVRFLAGGTNLVDLDRIERALLQHGQHVASRFIAQSSLINSGGVVLTNLIDHGRVFFNLRLHSAGQCQRKSYASQKGKEAHVRFRYLAK